jgi:ATP-dependent helicase HrpA
MKGSTASSATFRPKHTSATNALKISAHQPVTPPTKGRHKNQTVHFEAAAEDDGVTLEIPLPLLAQLEDSGFNWLVPGLREELVTALLKTLPKAIRRNVVPAADWACRLLALVELVETRPVATSPTSGVAISPRSTGERSLTEFLATEVRRLTHMVIAPSDFEPECLSPHLRTTFAAIDQRGTRAATSTNLVALQHRLAERSRERVAKATAASAPRGVPGSPCQASSAPA